MQLYEYRHLVLQTIDLAKSLVERNDDDDTFFSLGRQLTHLKTEAKKETNNPFVEAKRLVSIVKKIMKRKNNQKPYKYMPTGKKDIKTGGNVNDLGKRIKIFRIKSGMKQIDLARKLEVSSNYISIIENGKKEPSMRFMRRLATTLKIPMDIFFLPLSKDVEFNNPQDVDRYKKLLSLLELIFSSRVNDTQQKMKHGTKTQHKNA